MGIGQGLRLDVIHRIGHLVPVHDILSIRGWKGIFRQGNKTSLGGDGGIGVGDAHMLAQI
jgi:hypothetical protein